MPYDAFRQLFFALPGEIARLQDHGADFVVRYPAEPRDDQKRLLDTLGVRWEVQSVTPRNTTEKTHAPDGSLTMSEINRRDDAFFGAQPTKTACGVDGCDWAHEGPATAGRLAFLEHSRQQHPAVSRRKREQEHAEERRLAEQRARAAAERVALEETERAVAEPGETGSATRLGEGAAATSSPAAPLPVQPAVSSNTTDDNPWGLRKRGRGYAWTTEAAIDAVRAYTEAFGKTPSAGDAENEPVGTLPSSGSARALFGNWPNLITAARATVPEPLEEAAGRPQPTASPSGDVDTPDPTTAGPGAPLDIGGILEAALDEARAEDAALEQRVKLAVARALEGIAQTLRDEAA